jgi:hydroxymethylpyrimidine/phosphomethylpyrimidine kinase
MTDIGADVLKTGVTHPLPQHTQLLTRAPGMLGTAEMVSKVAHAIRTHRIPYTVIDPVCSISSEIPTFPFLIQSTPQVMVATTGHQLLAENAVDALIEELLPLATLLTPNIPEAELLVNHSAAPLNQKPDSVASMIDLAQRVLALGPKNVLLKGGHLPLADNEPGREDRLMVYNILVSKTEPMMVFKTRWLDSKNTHGTGCSLACE